MCKRALALAAVLLLLSSWVAGQGNPAYADQSQDIEGNLLKIDLAPVNTNSRTATIHMKMNSGETVDFDITSGTQLLIDKLPVAISDFRPGMEVYATIGDNGLKLLEAFSTPHSGYINPRSIMITGYISEFASNEIHLQTDNGQEKVFYFNDATIVYKSGQVVPIDTLYEGDRVKLYLDDTATSNVSSIQVQGNSVLINHIFKGNFYTNDDRRKTITLKDIQVLQNGDWQTSSSLATMPYASNLLIYYSGQQVPVYRLKYFQGKTVYLVTQKIMGSESIVRMVFKNQYEACYSGKVNDINRFTEAFDLNNQYNIGLNGGTMVIKNGRLLDNNALKADNTIYVVADGSSKGQVANLVCIYDSSINNSSLGQYHLYYGTLTSILADTVHLHKIYDLDNDSWESYQYNHQYQYDNDTIIYDLEEGIAISKAAFMAGDYTINSGGVHASSNNLQNWYAYIYCNGERIVAITVQKSQDQLDNLAISTGIVDTTTKDTLVGWVASVCNVVDRSNYLDQWLPGSDNEQINIDKTLIVKDGQQIAPDSLISGDRLYVLRNNYLARIVLVK